MLSVSPESSHLPVSVLFSIQPCSVFPLWSGWPVLTLDLGLDLTQPWTGFDQHDVGRSDMSRSLKRAARGVYLLCIHQHHKKTGFWQVRYIWHYVSPAKSSLSHPTAANLRCLSESRQNQQSPQGKPEWGEPSKCIRNACLLPDATECLWFFITEHKWIDTTHKMLFGWCYLLIYNMEWNIQECGGLRPNVSNLMEWTLWEYKRQKATSLRGYDMHTHNKKRQGKWPSYLKVEIAFLESLSINVRHCSTGQEK